MGKVFVIGIGFSPLSARAGNAVRGSSAIMASQRLFEIFSRYDEYDAVAQAVVVLNNVDDTIRFMRDHLLRHQHDTVTLLAAGDPFFYGIGRRATEEFGRDNVEVLPDLSCMQVAFARIRESWDDALLISLHGGPIAGRRRRLEYELTDLSELVATHKKIGILTDRENNPAVIAGALRDILSPSVSIVMFVCERLGYDDETITAGPPEEIAKGSLREPNVVIVMSERSHDDADTNRSGGDPSGR